MKQITSILLAGSITLFLSACGGGGGSSDIITALPPTDTTNPIDPIDPIDPTDPTDPTAKLSYIDLTNASSLIISPNSSVYQSKGLSVSESTETNENIVLMVTDDGYIEEVTFTDENGMETTSTSNPLHIENVNSDYMLIAFGDNKYNVDSTYLIRKSDGALYELEESLSFPEDGFKNDKAIKTDSNGNAYLLVTPPNLSNYTNILKIDMTNPELLTKTTINPDTDRVRHFEVDNNGNVIYWAYQSGDEAATAYSRIIKANGGIQNIADTYSFWKGLDGVLYSDLPVENNIIKHTISSDYTYSPSSIEYPEGMYCNMGWDSYIIYTPTSILTTDPGDHNICEVYNNSMIPRKLNTDLTSIKAVEQNDNHYYIAGNDDSNNPVLRRFNQSDDTYIDVLTAGEYDVYKFTVSSTNEITFNALRMNDGIKVIGEVSPDGIVTIIDSEANAEIVAIEVIN